MHSLQLLANLITVKHGYAFKGEYFKNSGEQIVLTPGNFHEEGGFRLRPGKEKFYAGPIPTDYVLNQGDLIVAMTEQGEGLLGSTAIVPESGRFLHNQRLGLIRPKEGVDLDLCFIYYLFNTESVRQQIRATASGAKVRHTSPSRIGEVKASIPPVETQRRIASILSAYDDLIENNTRRIAILEEMARRIYEEWFVHFRFPGHEQVKMVESELGLIPEGWSPSSVGQCVTVYRGKSYKSSELADEGGLPFVNLKCMERDGGFRKSGLKRFTGSYKETQKVKTGDLVMAVTDMTQERRIVARCGRIPRIDSDFGVISMDLVKIDANKGTPREYVYGMLRWAGFADEVKQHANGANVLHLSPDRIAEYRFPLPTATLAQRFASLIAPMLNQCDVLLEKNENLRTTRDLLLPKLISGELDVSNLPEFARLTVPEEAIAA